MTTRTEIEKLAADVNARVEYHEITGEITNVEWGACTYGDFSDLSLEDFVEKVRSEDERVERYLKVVNWAERRYSRNGRLIVSVGGNPSRWGEIAEAAWRKYITQEARQ